MPPLAIAAAVVIPGVVVAAAVAANTFAYDFFAYHLAANRVLAGQPLYDPTIKASGVFGLYYYPPPFVLAILPFALLASGVAVWVWLGLSAAMLVAGIWLMPVSPTVRWATLLLAGLSWPVAYALKLGQVGPLLFLLFAAGWRWLDRPGILGLSGALGAMVKIQPGIVLAWAVLTHRWRAVVIGSVILVVGGIIATLVAGGPSIWGDYAKLLGNVSDATFLPHNYTPGAVAFQLGVPAAGAVAIQVAASIAVVLALIVAARRLRADASYLVAVIASQLLSPVLWDHYAMLLLLPVAWMLERRRWWALLIPLATSVVVLPIGQPAVIYPLVFWAALAGVIVVGRHEAGPGATNHAVSEAAA